MNPDIQRANMWSRIAAGLLDAILLVVLVTGIATLLGSILNYNDYVTTLNDGYTKYEEMYDVTFGLNEEEFNALPPEEQEKYTAASNAMDQDEEVLKAYDMTINLTFIIASVSVLVSYLLLEFLVPLLFGNGQTLGKKMFNLALMRTDGVKLTTFALFVRSILGKCTIETMIPVMMMLAMVIAPIGLIAPTIIFGILAINIGLLIANQNRPCIHDLMAVTVVIDHGSQQIFDTPEDLLEYKKKLAADDAERQEY